MKVRLGKFTDGDTEWVSLIIDNISIAQMAVKQIIGQKLSEAELNAHSLYTTETHAFLNLNTGKSVFKDLCTSLYKDKHLVMNMNGGYIPLESIDWTLLETLEFEFEYGADLNRLLRQQNGKEKEFKLVST